MVESYSEILQILNGHSWDLINEDDLIDLISALFRKCNNETKKIVIDRLFLLKKYRLIEHIYRDEYNKDLKTIIIKRTREYIYECFDKEDVFFEDLEASNFLGLLCDKKNSNTNLNRSFEVLSHIKTKKYTKIS